MPPLLPLNNLVYGFFRDFTLYTKIETMNAALWRQFCEVLSMTPINTWKDSGHTFNSQSSDAKNSIDYILVPRHVFHSERATHIPMPTLTLA